MLRLVEDHALFGDTWQLMSTPSIARLTELPEEVEEGLGGPGNLPEPLLEPQVRTAVPPGNLHARCLPSIRTPSHIM